MAVRRSPQVSLEAEAAVLGTLLVVPESIYEYELVETLAPEDFSDRRHQAVYTAILACEADNRPYWDLVVLCDELSKQGALDRIGGREFVEQLLGAPGEVSSMAAHVEIVSKKAVLRKVASTGQAMIDKSTTADAEAEEVLEFAEQAVFSLGSQTTGEKFVYMGEAMRLLTEQMEANQGKEIVGLTSGFPTLDKLTSGFQPGQLIVLAGRPGMGKSSAALQWARHAAETSGDHVLFISYEMTRYELLTRLVSMATEMTSRELRRGEFTPEQARLLGLERQRLTQLPLGIHDRPPLTIAGLRSVLRREARKKPVSMVVIDYIQLMSGSRMENRTQEITEISRGLKVLAGELEVPIIGLSQLNRGVEVRGSDNYRPRLSDLRDSGSIEQDADAVIFTNRPVVIQPGYDPRYAELVLAKQRAGQAGVVIECDYDGRYTKFTDKGLVNDPVTTTQPSGYGSRGGAPF